MKRTDVPITSTCISKCNETKMRPIGGSEENTSAVPPNAMQVDSDKKI